MVDSRIVLKARSKGLEAVGQEFIDLVTRCYRENPSKKDLKELKGWLKEIPKMYSSVFDLSEVVRDRIFGDMLDQAPAQIALDANIEDIKAGMGYKQAPMIEKLLIDQVVNAWLRYQWAELVYQRNTNGSHGLAEGDYWLGVLNASQRRYLRALESLARVRKITRATMQINIAEAGSQQVNIAGDVNRNGGKDV